MARGKVKTGLSLVADGVKHAATGYTGAILSSLGWPGIVGTVVGAGVVLTDDALRTMDALDEYADGAEEKANGKGSKKDKRQGVRASE